MLESLTAVRFSTVRFYVLILCPPDRLQTEDLIIDLNCHSRGIITYKSGMILLHLKNEHLRPWYLMRSGGIVATLHNLLPPANGVAGI